MTGQPDNLCAVAPDPDADFKAGVRHGYQLGVHAPSPVRWTHRRPARREELIKLAVAVAGIVAVAALMIWDAVS